MEGTKRKKVIYSRKLKYTGKDESIENQIDTCKHYLKNYIDTTLTDDGNEITFLDVLKTPKPDFVEDINIKDYIVALENSRSYVSRIEKRALTKMLREFIRNNHHLN